MYAWSHCLVVTLQSPIWVCTQALKSTFAFNLVCFANAAIMWGCLIELLGNEFLLIAQRVKMGVVIVGLTTQEAASTR